MAFVFALCLLIHIGLLSQAVNNDWTFLVVFNAVFVAWNTYRLLLALT